MTDANDDITDDKNDDTLDRVLFRGFAAAGDEARRDDPAPAPSVIGRIGEITGTRPSILLREIDPAGQTPMLKPLTSGDGIEQETGKYMVQGILGQGGVGAVHKGHDTDLGRDVAMKFLHEKYKDEPAILHRFVEEAQIGGQLQHPGIVPVYELGMADGRPFFTMKMVKGQTLAKKLAKRPTPADDRRTFLSIFEDVCQTMAYAHARGVVHRDLKPANIMIGAFGEVQVVDWGMGKVLRQGGVDDERLAVERQTQLSVIETVRSEGHGTQSIMGSVMGTPAYMPPEQARGDVEAMDERSDVFALGAILCEVLTGQPPYLGEQAELIAMAARAQLDDAHERLQHCGADPELIALAKNCMMPAPAARPMSAEEVAQGIHDYLAAAEAKIHTAQVTAAEERVRAGAAQSRQRLAFSLVAVVAVGMFASLWLWLDADEQRNRATTAVAKEKVALSAAEANLSNFNSLSHLVRLEAARATAAELYPAWPYKEDAMRAWLKKTDNELNMALPELRATLVALEKKALPETAVDPDAARQAHPRGEELTRLENKLTALRRANSVRTGSAEPESFTLDESLLVEPYNILGEMAVLLMGPNRAVFGREAEGLALAHRALAKAADDGEAPAWVIRYLAWALFANGLDDDALASSKAARASAAKLAARDQARSDYYCTKLESLIAAASGDAAKQIFDDLTTEIAELTTEVSARTSWQFKDDATSFLHSTVRQLIADIEEFAKKDVVAVEQSRRWASLVEELTITRHREQWNEARLAILKADGVTASKLYGASPIELIPQMGLVPIGMNPETLLWEFYHLRSAWDGSSAPATIALPEHREDGSIEVTGDTGIVFVLLPGGTYMMGAQRKDPDESSYDEHADDDECPHIVTLSPFLLAKHELTQGQWARLWSGDKSMRYPSTLQSEIFEGTLANPVEQVDWSMSGSLLMRHGLALPTEAQWEYGCRGTTKTPYWCAPAELKNLSNLADASLDGWGSTAWESWLDGHLSPAAVGSLGANDFGLYDMHGNVSEWCQDCMDQYRGHRAGDGLQPRTADSYFRSFRGGSWLKVATAARSANRAGGAETSRRRDLGLRPARALRLLN